MHLTLKASSLVETLVATVIIIVLFSIASLTLNNIFTSVIRNNFDEIDTHLSYLHYQYLNNQIKIPYHNTSKDWDITIQRTNGPKKQHILFEARNIKHKKMVFKKITDAQK